MVELILVCYPKSYGNFDANELAKTLKLGDDSKDKEDVIIHFARNSIDRFEVLSSKNYNDTKMVDFIMKWLFSEKGEA